jgi:hypothetical protein
MENIRSLSYEELERDVEQLQRLYKVLENLVEDMMKYVNLSLFRVASTRILSESIHYMNRYNSLLRECSN